jgi:hypothetical protein
MPRKPNSGSFKPGFDPRRHVFSKAELRKGYRVATQERKLPSRVRAWLWRRVKRYYRERRNAR